MISRMKINNNEETQPPNSLLVFTRCDAVRTWSSKRYSSSSSSSFSGSRLNIHIFCSMYFLNYFSFKILTFVQILTNLQILPIYQI
jgi:hypothetical protein